MTVTCRCIQTRNGVETGHQLDNQENCSPDCAKACSAWALTQPAADSTRAECVDTGLLLGVSVAVFIALAIVSIIVFALMIWFSIHVMNKCKGKPKWLKPTIIILLVLWILMGWLPPAGLLFFIVLLVILIIYNGKCKKR